MGDTLSSNVNAVSNSNIIETYDGIFIKNNYYRKDNLSGISKVFCNFGTNSGTNILCLARNMYLSGGMHPFGRRHQDNDIINDPYIPNRYYFLLNNQYSNINDTTNALISAEETGENDINIIRAVSQPNVSFNKIYDIDNKNIYIGGTNTETTPRYGDGSNSNIIKNYDYHNANDSYKYTGNEYLYKINKSNGAVTCIYNNYSSKGINSRITLLHKTDDKLYFLIDGYDKNNNNANYRICQQFLIYDKNTEYFTVNRTIYMRDIVLTINILCMSYYSDMYDSPDQSNINVLCNNNYHNTYSYSNNYYDFRSTNDIDPNKIIKYYKDSLKYVKMNCLKGSFGPNNKYWAPSFDSGPCYYNLYRSNCINEDIYEKNGNYYTFYLNPVSPWYKYSSIYYNYSSSSTNCNIYYQISNKQNYGNQILLTKLNSKLDDNNDNKVTYDYGLSNPNIYVYTNFESYSDQSQDANKYNCRTYYGNSFACTYRFFIKDDYLYFLEYDESNSINEMLTYQGIHVIKITSDATHEVKLEYIKKIQITNQKHIISMLYSKDKEILLIGYYESFEIYLYNKENHLYEPTGTIMQDIISCGIDTQNKIYYQKKDNSVYCDNLSDPKSVKVKFEHPYYTYRDKDIKTYLTFSATGLIGVPIGEYTLTLSDNAYFDSSNSHELTINYTGDDTIQYNVTITGPRRVVCDVVYHKEWS